MYEEQLGWPPMVWLVLGAFAALAIIGTLAALLAAPEAGPFTILPLVLIVITIAAVGVIFRRLRIAIDQTTLTVGFGPFQERLPLTAIASCGPTTYRWLEFGGWGIRYNLRHPRQPAKIYNVMGDGGQAVQVVLADGRHVLFSARDPAAVCQALRARRPMIGAIPD